MNISWYPCPHCGQRAAQLIRHLPIAMHYHCNSCLTAFVKQKQGEVDPNRHLTGTGSAAHAPTVSRRLVIA